MCLAEISSVRFTRADWRQAEDLLAKFVDHRTQHQEGALLQHEITAHIVNRCRTSAHGKRLRQNC